MFNFYVVQKFYIFSLCINRNNGFYCYIMLNSKRVKGFEGIGITEVHFLWRMCVLKVFDVKKITYESLYNMALFKGERGVHFLWK